jgi:hypothetical protein
VKGGRKVWLITGSSRGFGAELVAAVLESGDAVLATARHPEDIRRPSDEHRERFRTAPLDVTDPGAAEAAVVSPRPISGASTSWSTMPAMQTAPTDRRCRAGSTAWNLVRAMEGEQPTSCRIAACSKTPAPAASSSGRHSADRARTPSECAQRTGNCPARRSRSHRSPVTHCLGTPYCSRQMPSDRRILAP